MWCACGCLPALNVECYVHRQVFQEILVMGHVFSEGLVGNELHAAYYQDGRLVHQ